MRSARFAFALVAATPLLVACGPDGPRGVGSAGAGGASAGAAGGGAAGNGSVGGGGAGGVGGSVVVAGATSGGFPPVMPVGSNLGKLTVESVAVWKNDAKGAYTIIHDDICDYNIDSLFDIAEPELTMRGLPSAFGAIVSRCSERSLWPRLEKIREHGHEIINHSWAHKDIALEASYDVEVDQATQYLDMNLVNQKTSFFIFPYDSFNDAAVQHLGTLGYLGARAGTKGVNAADFPDGMRVMFDVWGGENSKYNGQGDILQIYVDLAIAEGGWSVREFHGIADMTFWPMELPAYRTHLDYVKTKVDAGELWVDTPSNVVRYRFARQHCGLPSSNEYELAFTTPLSADCVRYAAPLTVVLTTEQDAPSAIAVQNGKEVKTERLAEKRFAVELDPAQGPAAFGGGT